MSQRAFYTFEDLWNSGPSSPYDRSYPSYSSPTPYQGAHLSHQPRHKTIHYVPHSFKQALPTALSTPILLREKRYETVGELLRRYFLLEEVELVMNKLSMFALLFGLMFLGTIFFLTGFLVAVNVYSPKPIEIPQLAHDPLTRPTHTPSQNPVVNVAYGMPTPAGSNSAVAVPQYLPAPTFAQVNGVQITQQPRIPTSMQAPMIAPHPQQGQMIGVPQHRPVALPPVPQPYQAQMPPMPNSAYGSAPQPVTTAQHNYNFAYQ